MSTRAKAMEGAWYPAEFPARKLRNSNNSTSEPVKAIK